MDETPVQVLKEDNKPNKSKSNVWLMKSDTPENPVITYHYAPTRVQTVSETLLGKAIGYTLNELARLVVYSQDDRLNIDNNLIENAIRPFAIGRKNWLFSQSTQGAETSANRYNVIETANGINEHAHLKLLFTEQPCAKTLEQFQIC